jgi:transcriptional regulator with XRE-family HTH domain
VYRQPTTDPRSATYRGGVDNRAEVKDFLTTRRARLTPQRAGLTAFSLNRRVPGLKRGEVADLAGVSVEYYSQLERGDLAGVSDVVLDSLARALQLDEAEREHLADLARAAGPASPRTRRRSGATPVRPGVQRLLDLMGHAAAAIVNDGRLNVVAANTLGARHVREVGGAGPPGHSRGLNLVTPTRSPRSMSTLWLTQRSRPSPYPRHSPPAGGHSRVMPARWPIERHGRAAGKEPVETRLAQDWLSGRHQSNLEQARHSARHVNGPRPAAADRAQPRLGMT